MTLDEFVRELDALIARARAAGLPDDDLESEMVLALEQMREAREEDDETD